MIVVRVIENAYWVYYFADGYKFDPGKVGKWMYFFKDHDFVAGKCQTAVYTGVVEQCKHSSAEEGVACFYLEVDDVKRHRQVLEFLIANEMVPRTKSGRLYNIGFKLDNQTRAGEYGDGFKAKVTLDQFVDLETGEWIFAEKGPTS